MKKIAVVLFNLGGPDKLESVEKFLFNIFNDKMIINIPTPFRQILAKIISKGRSNIAQDRYNKIGGYSPLLEQTLCQASELENLFSKRNFNLKVFISMRYWHPMSKDVVIKVKQFQPDLIIMLPLYPQYSKVTTGSSFSDWEKKAKHYGLNVKTEKILSWPVLSGWVQTIVENIENTFKSIKELENFRILFSAHGLPERVIKSGDFYKFHVECSVYSIISKLNKKGIDYKICYQSKVGPAKWIGPDIKSEIYKAANDKKSLIIVPISFVSENLETLYDLDIEYRNIAIKIGIKEYIRIETSKDSKLFINDLKNMIDFVINNSI